MKNTTQQPLNFKGNVLDQLIRVGNQIRLDRTCKCASEYMRFRYKLQGIPPTFTGTIFVRPKNRLFVVVVFYWFFVVFFMFL